MMCYTADWIVLHLLYGYLYIPNVTGLEFILPYFSNYGTGENSKIILRCKVKTYAEPYFEWMRIDNTTSAKIKINDTDDGRYLIHTKKVGGRRYISKLVIRNTIASDSGTISCSVRRLTTVIERQFKVQIHESGLNPTRIESYTHVGEGVVEILQRNKWNRFTCWGFTAVEASVVCHSLGYPYGGEARTQSDENRVFYLHYKKRRNKNRMCIFGIRCLLKDTDISQCYKQKNDECDIDLVVGVTCRLQPLEVPDVPVRLVIPGFEVQNSREGVVEVFLNGVWGFVCHDGIGQFEVDALCQTLGFRNGGISYQRQAIYKFALFDLSRAVLQNLSCPENASNYNECSHLDWGEGCRSCQCDSWGTNLVIRCWTKAEINKSGSGVRVRLAASNIEHEGRVEILHNNIWGTVTKRWLGYPGANMICKMIGYKYGGVPIFDAIPHTPGPVWINYIQCPLDANDLLDCYFVWRNQDRVVMDGDISVKCRTEPVEVPDVKFRLIGPRSDTGKGRLEYFRDGYWGSVCSFHMGTSEASLFCHILGFTYGGHILINKKNYGRSDLGPVLLGGIECPWNSEDLDQCSERLWAFEDFRNVCSFLHQYDVELDCRSDPFPDYEIQLFGGNSNNEGQLLLKYHDKWSTVYYDHGFSATNVAVVCKQLGYRHGGEMHTKQSVYENSRRKWLILECNGKEQNVGHCNTVREEDYHYSDNAVFIKCYETSDTELQMTVSLESDGKVIVHRQGETWKICAYDWEWDDVGATTVCRMLNNSFSDGTATHLPYELSSQNDPEMENSIQLLYCPRGVSHLGDCFYGRDPDTRARWLGPWGPGDCANDKYEVLRAGVRCNI